MLNHRHHGTHGAPIECAWLTIRPLPGRQGLALTGEADFTSHCALHGALSEELAGRAGDVHLELGGLRFIDLCCTREIVTATRLHPAAHVIIHHPPVALRRIFSLMWTETGIDMA